MLSTGIFMNEMSDEWDLSDTETGVIGTISVLGILLGTCTFGFLSDRLGRSFVFKRTLIIAATASFILTFARNYAMALVLMLLLGFGVGGDIVVAGTAFTEFCPTNKRWTLALLAVTWNFGSCISAGLAWLLVGVGVKFVHMWRLYSAIMAGILMAFWIARLGMDESPKYLAMKGRYKEARDVIEKIARRNGISVSPLISNDSLQVPKTESPAESPVVLSRLLQIKRLFQPPYLRTTLFLSPVRPPPRSGS